MDIHVLQASILDNIQQITTFTYQDDIEMTPSSLMVAIRLLIKCDTALETIENGLNITLPGSMFQYYRAVFTDYEDIILEQKTSFGNSHKCSRRNQATSSKSTGGPCLLGGA
jgi:hypothetical protein